MAKNSNYKEIKNVVCLNTQHGINCIHLSVFMMRFVFVLMAFFLICGTSFAGNIPDSIGGIKLGQKNAPIKEMKNVKFAGFKGLLYAYPAENGDVDTLRFSAGGCSELEEEGEEPCLKIMKSLRTKYIKELGKPKSEEKTNIVWEQDEKRLTLGWDYTGGQGNEICIYIEKVDDTKPGNVNDGFKEFYKKFKQAYNNNDRELLNSMMKFPFMDRCSLQDSIHKITINRPGSFDGNLKKVIKSILLDFELKNDPVFCRYSSPKMYFSSHLANGIGFQKVKGKWYAIGVFCGD